MRIPNVLRDGRCAAWVPWLCGLLAAAIAARSLVGAYCDFGIYLDVAREFRAGGFDIYRDRIEVGPWLYPHVAVLPFVALDAVFGDAGSRWVWSLLLGLGTALLLRDTSRALRAFGGLRWWQWLAFGVLFQRCLAQNLTHGQLSLLVGVFVAGGVVHLQQQRDRRAGAWFAIAAALKLTPVLFLPALPLMRRPRAAAAMLVATAAAVLLVPLPFCGLAEHLRHLGDFWRTVSGVLSPAGPTGQMSMHAGPSISGTLDYLLQPTPFDLDGHTVNVLSLGDSSLRLVKLAWSAFVGGLLLAWFWLARRHPEPQRLALQSAAVMLAMLFFTPLVRVLHLATAMLPFALFCRGPRDRRDGLWWAVATAMLFAMTLRQKNLIGATLWRTLDGGGLLHFALVAMLIWLVRATRYTAPPRCNAGSASV
ncbi:MAG TPA: glycosyltransferase 87 family protein [Planctomycetota bacterium]|nr:glycosyltransferase 87 family protein [Planctomycetota bacterium]